MPTLGELLVADAVYFNVGGVRKKWLVINQGRPTEYYGEACNGTWLLMDEIHTTMVWDATDADYLNSDVHAFLNGDFLALLDENVRKAAVTVKVPYRKGASGSTIGNKENGIECKAFLLSYNEVGASGSSSVVGLGTTLPYFDGITDADRRAYYNGTATKWWTRSVSSSSSTAYPGYCVGNSGNVAATKPTTTGGVRPAMVFPYGAIVDETGTLIGVEGSAVKGYANKDGTWKELTGGYANKDGAWKELTGAYKNINGEWKE